MHIHKAKFLLALSAQGSTTPLPLYVQLSREGPTIVRAYYRGTPVQMDSVLVHCLRRPQGAAASPFFAPFFLFLPFFVLLRPV